MTLACSVMDPLPSRTVFTVKPFPDLPITIATYEKADQANLEPELSKVINFSAVEALLGNALFMVGPRPLEHNNFMQAATPPPTHTKWLINNSCVIY